MADTPSDCTDAITIAVTGPTIRFIISPSLPLRPHSHGKYFYQESFTKRQRKQTVEESLGEPAHRVVAEVDMLERDVARREDLSGQQLPTHMLLTELLQIDICQNNSTHCLLVKCQITWM